MARLIRMDQTGHTTLAEWTPGDPSSAEAAIAAFREELDAGYYAVVSVQSRPRRRRRAPSRRGRQ